MRGLIEAVKAYSQGLRKDKPAPAAKQPKKKSKSKKK